jgi:hypothetical protein
VNLENAEGTLEREDQCDESKLAEFDSDVEADEGERKFVVGVRRL